MTPGSTTAVVVRNTLGGGRGSGLVAAAGAALGNTSHATAAGIGLSLLFARWPVALSALRVVGALYFAWLGFQSVYRAAFGREHSLDLPASAGRNRSASNVTSFRQGLLANVLNPAIATFYLVVVPSFLPASAPRWYFAALAATHVVLALVCHSVWALAFDRLRRFFRSRRARRALEGATGLALLALALRVFLQA